MVAASSHPAQLSLFIIIIVTVITAEVVPIHSPPSPPHELTLQGEKLPSFSQVAGILKSFRLNDLGWQASSSHLLTHDLG